MKRVRSKLTYANVTATLALFLVLAGGSAVAAKVLLPKNSVGAKQLKKNAVTPGKLSASAKKTLSGSKGETGERGPEGAQGIQGPKGEKGEAGPAATALWAVVNGATGALVKSSGATSAHRRNTGEFEVFFGREVSACSYQVTLESGVGETAAEPRTGNADAVYVETFNSAGTLGDRTFDLAVFC